jgi:hypothetical protein
MGIKLVVLAPYYEQATFLWSPFLKGWVAKELRSRCVEPVVLWGNDCVPDKFAAAMRDPEVKGVLGVGHGSESEIVGQGNATLVKVGMLVPQEWKDDVFAPVSCLVGRRLVPYLVQQGVPAGIGEVTEYWFTAAGTVTDGMDPEEDPLLKYFLYAEYTFWFRLAEGATAGEAYDAMIEEYKRQAELAKQVDPLTWWCLQVDWQNRKFFGDRNYRLPPAPGRILTKTEVSAGGERRPTEKKDVVTVTGRVAAEDGSVPKGWVRVKASRWPDPIEKSDVVPLDSEGRFSVSFAFGWETNVDYTYTVTAWYGGWADGKCYVPSSATTAVTVRSGRAPTATKITKVEAEREGDAVHLYVEGTVADADGKPVAGGEVEIVVADTFPVRSYVKTGADGRFAWRGDVPVDWFDTKLSVTACFRGDELRMPSCDTAYAKFPPNWKVVAIIAGAAAVIIALVILAAILTG